MNTIKKKNMSKIDFHVHYLPKAYSYYYYLKKIREQEIEKIPVALPDPMEKPVLFKKLEVQTPIHTQAAVIIRLPAASLEIHNGATQQTIETVLLALNCLC